MIKGNFTQRILGREASMACELFKSEQVVEHALVEKQHLTGTVVPWKGLVVFIHIAFFWRNHSLISILKNSAFIMHNSHDDQETVAENATTMGIFFSVPSTHSCLIDSLYWIHASISPFFLGIPLSVFCFRIYTVSMCVLLHPSAYLPIMLCAICVSFCPLAYMCAFNF